MLSELSAERLPRHQEEGHSQRKGENKCEPGAALSQGLPHLAREGVLPEAATATRSSHWQMSLL